MFDVMTSINICAELASGRYCEPCLGRLAAGPLPSFVAQAFVSPSMARAFHRRMSEIHTSAMTSVDLDTPLTVDWERSRSDFLRTPAAVSSDGSRCSRMKLGYHVRFLAEADDVW